MFFISRVSIWSFLFVCFVFREDVVLENVIYLAVPGLTYITRDL